MQRNIAQPFAHLGSNFLKAFSNGSHLLYLDDNGWLLYQVALRSHASLDVKKAVKFAKTIGATSLVRVQKQSNRLCDGDENHSLVTRTLYEAVKFYRAPLRELVLITEDSE